MAQANVDDSVSQAIREQLVVAMEKRAGSLDDEARRVLDERVATLRTLTIDELVDAADDKTLENATPSRSPLGELVDSVVSDASPERAAFPELLALDDFRNLWSGIRSDSQLQQAVAQTPTNAGPLNSVALVSRSIALMRELSPAYLRQFLGYVDELAWLELVRKNGSTTAKGAAATKRRIRRTPRV